MFVRNPVVNDINADGYVSFVFSSIFISDFVVSDLYPRKIRYSEPVNFMIIKSDSYFDIIYPNPMMQ